MPANLELTRKKYFDMKSRCSIIETSDRVLINLAAFDGKHKFADKSEQEPSIVLKRPIVWHSGIWSPKEDGIGPVRTLHRNLLLPIGNLPLGQIETANSSLGTTEKEIW